MTRRKRIDGQVVFNLEDLTNCIKYLKEKYEDIKTEIVAYENNSLKCFFVDVFAL